MYTVRHRIRMPVLRCESSIDMTHEYDDPVTEDVIEAAVRLTMQRSPRDNVARLQAVATEAVDTVFCTCVTGAADASVRGKSPTHAGIIAEVVRRVQLRTASPGLTPDARVDMASEQSFPASDAPAWIWR